MEAVTSEVLGREVLPKAAGLGDVDQQVSEQIDELSLHLGDVLTSVYQRAESGVALLPVVADQRVGLQHRFESLARVAGLVSECGKMFELPGDVALTFWPPPLIVAGIFENTLGGAAMVGH